MSIELALSLISVLLGCWCIVLTIRIDNEEQEIMHKYFDPIVLQLNEMSRAIGMNKLLANNGDGHGYKQIKLPEYNNDSI
jgi:hypothetical protein